MNNKTKNQITEIIDTHKKMVVRFQSGGLKPVTDMACAIVKALKKGARIYICGNGGSAADAQHIAAELVNRFECSRKALPVIALTTDTSIITSIGNDFSFESVFARQAEAFVKKGDVFWAISTSGSSPNILAAVKIAKQKGALITAFTGKPGSTLEKLSDICLCAESKSAARSQEIHQLAYHIICGLVEQEFKK